MAGFILGRETDTCKGESRKQAHFLSSVDVLNNDQETERGFLPLLTLSVCYNLARFAPFFDEVAAVQRNHDQRCLPHDRLNCMICRGFRLSDVQNQTFDLLRND